MTARMQQRRDTSSNWTSANPVLAAGEIGHQPLVQRLPHTESLSLSEVIIHEDENFERALKRFKKKCEKAGIMADLRRHQHFEKPSERRKRKLNAAKRKNMARKTQEN